MVQALYIASQVRKAIHVDVPSKNGKDWQICGGIQYSSDFGSLLPHYKSTLIPAIKVLIFNGDVDCCVPCAYSMIEVAVASCCFA